MKWKKYITHVLLGFLCSWVCMSASAQEMRQITGTVVDTTGVGLPGVSVAVKGSTNMGTSTDLVGKYILDAPVGSTLVYSLIGFQTQEIAIGDQSQINVTLAPSTDLLDDVVVVAFGQQKRSDLVGSVTSVNPSELKVPSSNLTTALAGRVAGVIAFQRSGEPGMDNADFFIRGVTTFGYKKDPLILIDGIEMSSTDLARLNPDDIASFSVMKDATATSLYGSRAANGVILVTTKEGVEGKAKISFRFENSLSQPTREVELADPITYMRLHNEAVLTRDPLGERPYSDEKIDNTIEGTNPYMYPTTDWRKMLVKDYTMNQRINMNVSGGGKVARYFVAGSFNQDNGILNVDKRNNFNNNINLKTYSLRSNVNVDLTKSTEMVVRLSGLFDDYNGPINGGADVYRKILRSSPVSFPAYYPVDEDHQYVQHILFGNSTQLGPNTPQLNPYADLVRGYKEYSRSKMSAQLELKQDLTFITPGLNVRTLLNTDRYSYFDVVRAYNPFWYYATSYNKYTNTYRLDLMNEDTGSEYLSYGLSPRQVESSFYLESAANYSKEIDDKHSINGTFVFMVRNKLAANSADLQESLPFRNVGLAGRATYSYDSRYYAEFNFGYNGSERFHRSNRFGFFPSAGVAWTISNEKFWEPLESTVNNLRLRATYGLSGNDAIGHPRDRFLYLSNVNMNDPNRGAVFGRDNGYSHNGISISRYADPGITWETASKLNLALEIGLFDKANLMVDVFKDHRKNILMTRTATPAEMGLSAQPQTNVGEAEARGIDIQFDYNHVVNKDLWIQVMGNFTYATSKYLVYEEYEYEKEWWKSRVGYPINQVWGYIAERLFVDDAEVARSPRQNFGEYMGGDIKYRDVNGDGQITTLDQVPIGYPTVPEITYGFGFSVGYKAFDVSAFFQGLGRESFWINPLATAPFIPYAYENEGALIGVPQNQLLKAYADSYWSESNRDLYALWPRLSTTEIGTNNNAQTSTWFMRNGSFLRLKQVEIGYTLPQQTADKLFMQNLRVYLSGTNLLTWSSFKLWDVEMGNNGLGYPVQRVVNLGILANF